ncbi:thiamine phosphate synthase [Magnetococcus sp. PR-3]|uniref:thiamine phosphate synthase n=1 Tax=Magnetococcus sp. PR-3 TaxID=3120355 RepID=UPI002FCE0CB2
MSFSPRGLYPILDQGWLDQSGFHVSPDEVASCFARLAIPVLQLRSKGEGGLQWSFMEPWFAAFRKTAPATRLIVNDRVDIALALKADGIHVGQDDLPVAVCRQLLGDQVWVGLSTHNEEEIQGALASGCDYIGFGPIHATGTKANTYTIQGYKRLTDACTTAGDLPLVAIGGIGLDEVSPCIEAGASGVAMISALWRHENWAQRLEDAQARTQREHSA